MVYEQILYEIKDNILTLTLNRPDQLNAFTPQMRDELIDAFDRADTDDGVRAIIVTGAGLIFPADEAVSRELVKSSHPAGD